MVHVVDGSGTQCEYLHNMKLYIYVLKSFPGNRNQWNKRDNLNGRSFGLIMNAIHY